MMTTLKKQDFTIHNDTESLLHKSLSSGSISSNSDLSVESQLFNDNNLFFSPVSGSTGTATHSPLYDRSIKTLRSKLSSLSNNSLADITNTSHNSHFSHASNNSIDITSNRSSNTVEQKRMHILGRLNKRNSINSSTPYFYQYKCKSVVSSPLPTVEDDEINFVNENVKFSQKAQINQVLENNQNNQNNKNNTHEIPPQHSNSQSPNSNIFGIASVSGNHGDGSDGSDSGNDSFNNFHNKSNSSKSHNDSTLSTSTIDSHDITTSSSENNNTSLLIRNLQRNSVSIFNESTVSQSPQQNRVSKHSRFSQQTINTADFLHNRIDEIKESSYSLPILENDENNGNEPIFTIHKHNDSKNNFTTSQLNLKIANHSTSSIIHPINKKHASLPALVDITSYSEPSNTNNISDDSNISNNSKDNLLQNPTSIIYSNIPIKKCPNNIIYLLLLASLIAPPFYMVIATGLADSVFGRFPRHIKLLSTVLFTIFLLGAILGIAVGLGLGLT